MELNNLPDAGYMLEQLMHSTLDVIYFKDTHSRFTLYNRACADKHGWKTLDEGLGKTDFDLFAPEHARQSFDDEQRIMTTGRMLLGTEEKEVWPDGRITWCSSSKVPLRDGQGRIVGMFGITRDITDRKEVQLRARRYAEQMAFIKEELEEDARMAGQLQRSFFLTDYPVFPKGCDPSESCIEFRHHFNKSRLVSGDYCHVHRISETQVGILLCDVLGTGARAALGASLIRGIMEDIIPLAGDPTAYLEHLNEHLYPLVHPDSLLLDITACYLVLDVSTGEARVVSAGHPLPLHFRKDQPVKWLFENLVLRGPALAVEPHARYRSVTCRLQPGDSVVFFTDGLLNVTNARQEPFGEKLLLQAACELDDRALEHVFSALEKAALDYSKAGYFSDDVCMLGFKLRQQMECE